MQRTLDAFVKRAAVAAAGDAGSGAAAAASRKASAAVVVAASSPAKRVANGAASASTSDEGGIASASAAASEAPASSSNGTALAEANRAAARVRRARSRFPVLEHLTNDEWWPLLIDEFESAYFQSLMSFLDGEFAAKKEIFPPRHQIFNALNHCSPSAVKVVILGQDPYHDNGQANGLCFSVAPGVAHPPSLRNIFTELKSDVGCAVPKSGDLSRWASQGVLLLNTSLTVEAHKANSHAGKGWEKFTDAVIRLVNDRCTNVVFLLWGKPAQTKGAIVNTAKHYVHKSVHPSPLSASKGWFGSKPFSTANRYLESHGRVTVNWALTD